MSIYQAFARPDDVVTANQTIVTTGLWSGDTGSLNADSMFLYPTQYGLTGQYYFDVYNKNPTSTADPEGLAETQFAITYGHVNGGGAATLLDTQQAKLPTKAIYTQYKQLLLEPTDTLFTFANNSTSEHIYVINLQRARLKEQLDPGNWLLPLSGANGVFTFIDDSNQTLGATAANSRAGRVFNIVSGSLSGISGSITSSLNSSTYDGQGYGLVYPDLGIIVLNPNAICPMVGFFVSQSTTITGSAASSSITAPFYTTNFEQAKVPYAPVTHSTVDYTDAVPAAYNHASLYASLILATTGSSTFDFQARSAETISSTHYFVRLRNQQFNYSNNPTFANPDTGELTFSSFVRNPVVYITTVGLYNDANELLAVAKLSKPVRKSFDEELLLRVRLDF